MNEDELMNLLNNIDDDLADEEVSILMEGVKIDMESIKEKSYKKLKNRNKKLRKRKKLPYVIAACLCLLTLTTVYADNISEAIKTFMNKTTVYSTIVDGDAYYLKESYDLNEEITIESLMVSEGNLEMELITDLSLSELGEVKIIPQNNADVIYYPGGYSEGKEQEKNKYFFLFMNKIEDNYNIKPFKDFEINIAGASFDVSLQEAENFDSNDQIYISASKEENIGVDIGAKIFEKGEKLNIQLIPSFEDTKLDLVRFGKPVDEKVLSRSENLGKEGTISSLTGSITDSIYVFDERNNKYKLEIPENSKGYPVTIFETNAPKDESLVLKLPAIIARYSGNAESLSLNIPEKGEIVLNKKIDFNIQKAVVEKIKRTSPTSAQIEFKLNTKGNENIKIRDFDFYSSDIKKISAEFSGDKAVMNLEFAKNTDIANIEISSPHFLISGDWIINIK